LINIFKINWPARHYCRKDGHATSASGHAPEGAAVPTTTARLGQAVCNVEQIGLWRIWRSAGSTRVGRHHELGR